MAIAYDNSKVLTGTIFGSSTFTDSYTNNGNYLIVYVEFGGTADLGISGITYNGVSLTHFGSDYVGGHGQSENNSLWYLINPSTGSNTISITTTGSFTTGKAIAYSLSNAGPYAPEANTSHSTPAGTPSSSVSDSVTTLTNNAMVIGFCQYCNLNVKSQTAGTGATQRAVFTSDLTNNSIGIYDSNTPVTPTQSYSMTVNSADGSSFYWDLLMWSVKPVTHTITTSTSGAGSGTISPSGSVTIADGDNQTFTITANADSNIADVLVDGVSVGAVSSYTFTNVTADHTISVDFELNFVPQMTII